MHTITAAFLCRDTLPGWVLLAGCAAVQLLWVGNAALTLSQYLLASLGCYALMMAIIIVLRLTASDRRQRASAVPRWRRGYRRRATLRRLAYKTIGVAMTLLGCAAGALALAAWQLSIYAELVASMPWGLLGAVALSGWLLLCVLDACDPAPWDVYYALGRWLGHGRRLPQRARVQLLFSLVRGFFGAYGIFLLSIHWQGGTSGYAGNSFFDALMQVTDFAKITLGIGAFVVVSRLLDNHPRSVDTHPLSWLVTLACYPPLGFWLFGYFSTDMGAAPMSDPDVAGWITWFRQGALIALLLLYSSDILAWGDRFSQLSYRGLVRCGPFAFMRHPAYASKCLIFALTLLPTATAENWKGPVGFVLLACSLYALRAHFEGLHLRKYPEYCNFYFSKSN